MKRFALVTTLVTLFFATTAGKAAAANYYVDSTSGNDSNTCQQAQNQATPRRSVNGITSCNPGAGDTVFFRGTFNQTINPPQSGQVVVPAANIGGVYNSTVTFNSAPQNVNTATDYVTVYSSRKGNSGAFKVTSVSGNQIVVDTSALPGGQFVTEGEVDPGELRAAVIRPVIYTAWDRNNPPTWDFNSAMYYGFNRSVVMLSYLRSVSGANNEVWGAVYLDGGSNGSNDYFVMDHVEIQNAATSVGLSNNDFHANYGVLQHNRFHNVGWRSGVSDEVLYWGNFLQFQKQHDYVQVMYNEVGPQKNIPVNTTYGDQATGDGIEIKASAHYPTVYGNVITGIYLGNGCDDAPIRTAGQAGFIANNYISNVNPQPNNIPGCGISVVEGSNGANGTIVANNVISNVKSVGIMVFNTSNVQILNNTIYDVHPITGCCAEESAGIMIQTYGQPATNITIRNNILQNVPVGIGRYPWSTSEAFSVTTSNNIVFNATTPWGVGVTPSTSDRTVNPGLTNVAGGNFGLNAGSPAIGSGMNLATVFQIDNHNATNPSQKGTAPIARGINWDIGAYQVGTGGAPVSPSPVVSPSPSPSPLVSPSASPSPSLAASPSPSLNPGCQAADVDQNGQVDATDRAVIISYFFQTSSANPRADINGSGVIDLTDYALFAHHFGETCN